MVQIGVSLGFSLCYDEPMRTKILPLLMACGALLLAPASRAQSSPAHFGSMHTSPPTGGRGEPVRQFTFYVLTMSYADIVKEVESEDVLPSREQFIDQLKISAQLREWLNAHDVMDLTQLDLDKLVTPDDIISVPEFLAAYQRSNSGGVTTGLPTPKFHEADRETSPDKYNKQKADYLAAMKKFIQAHPSTVNGMELELGAVSPHLKWDKLLADHKLKVQQQAPDIAQSKYLAVKVETDLDGRALANGLNPGNYWVSSLGMDAASGDRRFIWDVATKIEAGKTTQLVLTNVNGSKPGTPTP